jgi:DNA-directed RNA polymerase specialized sigma24 family protein
MKKIDIEIFELYYYSAMNYNEISNALNISEFSIKSKLFRIRRKIRKELLKGGYSDEEL